jgi:hypothetical protein
MHIFALDVGCSISLCLWKDSDGFEQFVSHAQPIQIRADLAAQVSMKGWQRTRLSTPECDAVVEKAT